MGRIEGLECRVDDRRKLIAIHGSPEQLIEAAELIHAQVSTSVHREKGCDLRNILEMNRGAMREYQEGKIGKSEFDRLTENFQYTFVGHRLKIDADSAGEHGKESSLFLEYLMNDGGSEEGYKEIQATLKKALEVEI